MAVPVVSEAPQLVTERTIAGVFYYRPGERDTNALWWDHHTHAFKLIWRGQFLTVDNPLYATAPTEKKAREVAQAFFTAGSQED